MRGNGGTGGIGQWRTAAEDLKGGGGGGGVTGMGGGGVGE
jgi:hypothetical protein